MKSNQHQAVRFGRPSQLSDFLSRAVGFLLLVFSFGGNVFIPARAAQTPAPLTISSNRYLFIVDTSLSMKPRASGALQRIETLLLSDLNGNLRRGDTLGLWTYNDKVKAGQFPLQVWSPEQKKTIAKRFIAFMKNQPIEKKPKVAQALAQVSELVKHSDNLTVLLFSAGDEKMRGTPFDDEINAVYKKQNRAMQKAGVPFVTVLRAQDGKVFAHSVNFIPLPIDIPPFPGSVASPQPPLAKAIPTNLPPPVVSAVTNKVASTTSPEKVTPVTEVKNDKLMVTERITPKPAVPAPAAVNIANSVATSTAKSETPSVATSLTTSRSAPTTTVNEALKVEVATLKPSEPASPPTAIATPAVSSPPTESKAVATSVERKTVERVAQSTPLPDVARAEDQAAKPESYTPPVQTAAAVTPDSWLRGAGLLVMAIVLLLVALGLVVLFIRRARNMSQPSLITHSLDRQGN